MCTYTLDLAAKYFLLPSAQGLHVTDVISVRTGVGVETLNLEVATLDEVVDTIKRSAGFVVGSPTLGGHMPTQVPSHFWSYGLLLSRVNIL